MYAYSKDKEFTESFTVICLIASVQDLDHCLLSVSNCKGLDVKAVLTGVYHMTGLEGSMPNTAWSKNCKPKLEEELRICV